MDHHLNYTGKSDYEIEWTPFSLTHVEFPKGDFFGKVLAISSLMPMALICGFITLILFRRDLHTITFFIGLLINEGFNMILKYTIREARPLQREINYTEFGMPSSHSQLMWYFAAYSVYFALFRLHRYPGKGISSHLHKVGIILAVVATALFVTYSRIYLMYHTWAQVSWGAFVGCVFATFWFVMTETVFTPKFQEISSWTVCEYLLIKDTTLIPNVMWFEYANARQETKNRTRKFIKSQ
ncbi:dolichyldiphosphatase 1 [Folsomia candida]|uniref:Dolichyldiphosphatase n=1 Tax=Folsomia candida TaxID=158441 RepID=A0A226EZK0_FOLCA|nr:dolichyldiphosphatase 1 [Folsomia candida]OXA62560.1 Dolichyldiphosphatase 1 [Folsomia candida]